MFWDIFRHRFNFFDNLKFLAYFRQESASAIACLSRKAVSVVKTEDIHPPKTGISVHFCVLSLMAMQK